MASPCLVTTCMGRLADLRRTLGPMLGQRGGGPVIVVDYSCPDGSGDWVEANHPTSRVVRLPGQARFNLAAARNAGARHADSDWILFVDADVVLDPGFVEAVRPTLTPGGFYRAQSGDPGLGGTLICARADLERVGGYDEIYACWGEEDNDLFDAFRFVGLEQRLFPASGLRHLPHDDDARTRFYPVADRTLGHAINRVYRIVKWDLARLNGALPALETRRAIYEKVAEAVTASFGSGGPADLGVAFPHGIVPGGWSLARGLTYRLTKDP